MDRAFAWLINKIGIGTLIAFSLLICIATIAAFGLASLIGDVDEPFLWPAIILGTSIGWLLGKSRLAGWKSALVGIVIVLAANLLYFGKLAGPLVSLAASLANLILAALRWRAVGPPDPGPFLLAAESAWASLSAIAVRLAAWINNLPSGSPGGDPLPIALIWSLAIWGIALWAAWMVRRRQVALPAILPAAVLLASVLNYKRDNPLNLAILLALALLLLMAASHRQRQRRWEAGGLDYSGELELDLALIAGPLVIVIFLAAALIPSISIQGIVTTVQRWVQPQTSNIQKVGKSLGLGEPGVQEFPSGLLVSPGLPRSHLLGANPEFSRRTVMIVRTGDLPPGPPEIMNFGNLPNYHWRSATYDQYTGRGWKNGEMETVSYRAEQLAVPGDAVAVSQETLARLQRGEQPGDQPGYHLVRQEVHGVSGLGGVLYASGLFLTSDADYQALWRKELPGNGVTTADTPWLERGDLFGVKLKANEYKAISLMPAATETELRKAGETYPPGIARRYLDLPGSVPQRVRSLAAEITTSATSPYDKASAIEAYLRQIPYSLDIPIPPAGRDVADYFLFDLRQGYCDYYATAMVVMARSQGLPARLVIGYARGSYDPYQAQFTVTAADAHSWVEIYFPGTGWVEFEPTGNQAPIHRPDRQPTAAGQPLADAQNPFLENRSLLDNLRRSLFGTKRSPLWSMVVVVALIWLVVSSWLRFDAWRLRRLSPGKSLARIFQRLTWNGHKLAFSPSGATPYEFSGRVVGQLERLGQASLLGGMLKPAAVDVQQITDLYARASYSPRLPGPREKYIAIMAWNRLKWRLWAARVIKSIRETP